MILAEGYKAFRGTMIIVPVAKHIKPFEIYGDWIYDPNTDCWYGDGSSYPQEICKIGKED